MKIIDIHTHVFDRVAGITDGLPMVSASYGKVSIGNRGMQLMPPSFKESVSTAEMLIAHMDDAGVEKALMMSNPFYGYHNDYAAKAQEQYPDRLRGVALVNVLEGKAAADELAGIYEKGVLFGLKFEIKSTFQYAPETRLTDKLLEPVWECLQAWKQPVFIHMLRPCDIADVKTTADRYPEIPIVLCHLGADASLSPGADGSFSDFLSTIKTSSNIFMDTSTVPEYFEEEYPFSTSAGRVEQAWKELGPERLLWASDYPGMLKMATYKQLISYVLNGCGHIPVNHKELIMGKNAERLFFNNRK